eukprot:SAG11_NODE_5583_length_1517_cov_2.405501_4_plen_63_part_01
MTKIPLRAHLRRDVKAAPQTSDARDTFWFFRFFESNPCSFNSQLVDSGHRHMRQHAILARQGY